jgi:hypothetical protein
MRGRVPVRSFEAGLLEGVKEEAEKLTRETGVEHKIELYSKRYSTIGEGECFRPVVRRGFGDWTLGPVCRKVGSAGTYQVLGVNRRDLFPALPEAYSLPPEKEVLPWREGEQL